MAQAERIYISMIEVNKFIFFFVSWYMYFLKEIENMFFMFLSSCRNTRESLGELKKSVEVLACSSCSHSISCSPKLSLVFLQLDRNTVHVFYFLNIKLTIAFLIGQKCTVSFRNQQLWHHLAAEYSIIMLRTIKVTGNHVMYDNGAWFLRVIRSSSHTLYCLPSAKKQKHGFHLLVSINV